MENKEDWKKIEQYIENKNANIMNKYKINLNQDIAAKAQRSRLYRKIIKIAIMILIIVCIYKVVYSIYNIWASGARCSRIKDSVGKIVTETAVKTDLLGNGCYSYRISDIPNVEIHAVFVLNKDTFIEDSDERLCKYYFEQWKDKDKNKFIIDEKYDDWFRNWG